MPGGRGWGRTELRAQSEAVCWQRARRRSRCHRQVSARGSSRPGGPGLGERVPGRCGAGGLLAEGDGAAGRRGAGRARGGGFGGSFALDLGLAGTREAQVLEHSAEGFWGALSVALSLRAAGKTFPTTNAGATFCFYRGGRLVGADPALS